MIFDILQVKGIFQNFVAKVSFENIRFLFFCDAPDEMSFLPNYSRCCGSRRSLVVVGNNINNISNNNNNKIMICYI